MTTLGKIQQVSIEYGDQSIIQQVSLDIIKGSCVGIVGKNGEGKSTFLSLLAGEFEASKGSIQWLGSHPTIYYCKQNELMDEEVAYMQEEEDNSPLKWHVPKNRAYSVMSGGEKMKKRLSKAFSSHVHLLLLDEPTNHLDHQSLKVLVKLIQQFKGTVLIVSHNRDFLDQVATDIWEVENQKVTPYNGNYSAYRLEKEERRKMQSRLFDAQQKKIAKIEEQITSLQNWSAKAHADSTKQEGAKEYFRVKAKKMDIQIRSKRKRLEGELAKSKVEKPFEEKDVTFSIEGNGKQGHRVIESKCVSKVFGEEILWKNASFTIQRGEKVALIGKNGSGKSTWLRMVMGEEPFEGDLWRTNAMNIGYLQQTVDDLPDHLSPADWFLTEDYETQGQIRTLMTNLGFAKKHWELPIGSMSMGERLKLKLMAFMIEQKDLLILDEPTNHLDLPSIEQLENTLVDYPGTLLIVTHDSKLMEKLCTKVLLFENKQMKKIEMSYREWIHHEIESKEQQEIMRLETERQAILGELSFLQVKDEKYYQLDYDFKELTQQIKELKK